MFKITATKPFFYVKESIIIYVHELFSTSLFLPLFYRDESLSNVMSANPRNDRTFITIIIKL